MKILSEKTKGDPWHPTTMQSCLPPIFLLRFLTSSSVLHCPDKMSFIVVWGLVSARWVRAEGRGRLGWPPGVLRAPKTSRGGACPRRRPGRGFA